MISLRSLLGLALLSACAKADQLAISAAPVTSGAEIFQYLLQNIQGVSIVGTPSLSSGCVTGDTGTVNTFTAGNSLYDIDHGILIQQGCQITATVSVPATTDLGVNYFFYTSKDTTKVTGPFDAFSLTVQNLAANSNDPIPGDQQVTQTVQNLVNQNTNVGTRPSSNGVIIVPQGNDQITITLTNNRPQGRASGVAIAPFTLAGGANGDPSFIGFLGQQYQVHGSSNTVYSIISSPSFQYNARFDFLSEGQCRQGTECFAHPGNYFGQVGILIKDGEQVNKIQVDSGAVNKGLTVTVNDQAMTVGQVQNIAGYTITLVSKFEVAFESSEFSVVLQNSDMFLNQMLAIGSSLQSEIRQYKLAAKTSASSQQTKLAALPHGILGQTWQGKTYDNRWKYIQGQLFDYIQPEGIFGTHNKFNRFE